MATAMKEKRSYETLPAAARRCGLDKKTLRRWAGVGKLRLFQPAGPGGRVLVASDEVDRMIEDSVR